MTIRKLDISTVKSYISSNKGYELVSNEYKNALTLLEIRCPVGHIFPSTYKNFQIGRRCPECKGGVRKSGEDVYKEFIENGVVPQFKPSDYQNNLQRLYFLCPNHLEKGLQHTIYSNVKRNNHLCKSCQAIGRSGENSYNWKGGISSIQEYIRRRLGEWKFESLKYYNFQCDISNSNSDLVIHHLYRNFSDILDESLILSNTTLKSNIKDYSFEELDILTDICVKLHFHYGLGVCITSNLHIEFHQKYGKKNNTVDQYLEFKQLKQSQIINAKRV
jgi:hypothetical protein